MLMTELELRFVKRADTRTGRWRGTVEGDVTGRVTSSLAEVEGRSPRLFVTFDCEIEGAPELLQARLYGSIDTSSGRLSLAGSITHGRLAGSAVHCEGELVAGTIDAIAGILRIAA
jgi:hypothetical protein